jgi:hypothetical protein
MTLICLLIAWSLSIGAFATILKIVRVLAVI